MAAKWGAEVNKIWAEAEKMRAEAELKLFPGVCWAHWQMLANMRRR